MAADSLDEIFALIDECMSEQHQMYEHGGHEDGVGTDIPPSRPPSRGTVFLDWDGTNDPVVSVRDSMICSEYSDAGFRTSSVSGPAPAQSGTAYRNADFRPQAAIVRINPKDFRRRPVASSSPLGLTSMLQQQHLRPRQRQPPPQPPPQTHYSQSQSPSHSPLPQHHQTKPLPHPQSARAYKVHGHDPVTNFSYSYNGRIIHVHRPALARSASRASSSAYSEYYALDARLYDSGKEFRVVDTNKPLPELPCEEVAKSGKVEREKRKRDKVVGFIRRLMRVLDETGRMAKFRRSLARVGDSKGGKDGEWAERGYVT